MSNIQSLRGMKDIKEDEGRLFLHFIQKASQIVSRYRFGYLETPLLEESALFKRSVGESSDIVGKEMYQFIDKGDNDVCLRPEGTAGVVRMFVENKLDRAGGNHRYYYYGPMFRYERPQKGRLREFHQFGCESFGEQDVYEDAMIIMMVCEILQSVGIGYRLLLNSLGCQECVPPYKIGLVEHLKTLDLCEDCQRRIVTNPIRVLDCKNDSCKNQLKNAPKITHNLCGVCKDDFEKLKDILSENNISFEIDENLVRGLDYYTKTAFEFVSDEIGAQSAIAGGGRYDKLTQFLGGRETPAIGFAMGIERLLPLIKMETKTEDIYYIGALDEQCAKKLFQVVAKKRKETEVITDYKGRSFSKHLANAKKYGATMIALIGEKELTENTIWIKDLITQEETIKPKEEF